MIKYSNMFKALIAVMTFAMALSAHAVADAALAADRFALANQLAKRGLYDDALREYLDLRGADLPKDEFLFRFAETCRLAGRKKAAAKLYGDLLEATPQSPYADYARLNRALLSPMSQRAAFLCALDRDGAPKDVRQSALFHLGEAAEASGDMKGAAKYYSRAAQIEKRNSIAQLARLREATILTSSADAADRRMALAAYLDLAASPDESVAEEALFYSGYLSYKEGKHAEAASIFRRLLSKWPGGMRANEAKIYAAWSLYLSGSYGEALALAAPLRDGKNAEDAHYLSAASLRRMERRTEAIDAYSAALKAFPYGKYADSEWFERLALRAAESDSKGVLDDLAARADPPSNTVDRVFTYGYEAALAAERPALAVQYARRVAAGRDPSFAPRALYTAGLVAARMGSNAEAVRDWNELLTRYPESQFSADALRARGMEEIRLKEYRSATRTLAELERRFPGRAADFELFYWRGVAARGADDAPEAEKLFRAALKAKPTAEFEREIKMELAFLLRARGADAEAAVLFAELLSTKAAERLAPAHLAWAAETLLSVSNATAALSAAEALEKRNADASWNQIGAALAGSAHEAKGERDAALAAYRRALAADARTDRAAMAALALGRAESADGHHDEARRILSDTVERCKSQELTAIRVAAYAALADNEEARGDAKAALGYHLMVGTLFDDPTHSPRALARAAAILRVQGKAKEADELDEERRKRYEKQSAL